MRNCTDPQKRSRLVAYATYATEVLGNDALDVSGSDLFDTMQELPEDMWNVFYASFEASTEANGDKEAPTQEMFVDATEEVTPKQVMYASISNASTLHHFVCTASKKVPCIEALKDDTKPLFQGIMLDNGAAGTPSGLPEYLGYCNDVGIEPAVRPCNSSFVGLGKGIVRVV